MKNDTDNTTGSDCPEANCSHDHGCDPLGDGLFRMVPSGDIVDLQERNRRLGEHDMKPVYGVFGRSWDEIERMQGGKLTR